MDTVMLQWTRLFLLLYGVTMDSVIITTIQGSFIFVGFQQKTDLSYSSGSSFCFFLGTIQCNEEIQVLKCLRTWDWRYLVYLVLLYNFFVGYLFFYLFFLMHCWSFKIPGWVGEISVRGRYSLNWSWWGAFQLLPSFWWLMLLPGSRGVLGGGSKVFLWHIPLRRAVSCLGPFEGSRSGSKIVLSGVGQTFSVRRVIYIQWYELSIRVDG